YVPALGRFATMDRFYLQNPESCIQGNWQNCQLYTYALNDPVNYRDPNGLSPSAARTNLSRFRNAALGVMAVNQMRNMSRNHKELKTMDSGEKSTNKGTVNPASRQGAYEASRSMGAGTVGYGTHAAIGFIGVGMGSFGEAEIGHVFGSAPAQTILNKPSTFENHKAMAQMEYRYWNGVLASSMNIEGVTSGRLAGGLLGSAFPPTSRAVIQMGAEAIRGALDGDKP
ncbi:MAG: hypothetical protein M3Q07_26060, partial [Pseudobdellovibrionaceae bacterium]|nr:hypothetical protein [Pseudobdellovibrionaceae bacterium]